MDLITRGIKTNISKGLGNSGASFPMSTSSGETGLGRVTRVVLGKNSCSDDEWNLYQKSQALFGVFYRPLQTGVDGQVLETGAERFAYCPTTTFKRIPVVNEIIRVKPDMAPDLAAQNNNSFQQKVYWTDIIPAWNHPHLNMVPNLEEGAEETEDSHFKDQGNDINPVQLCPGDVVLEGRHGQSLRFGGTWFEGSPVAVKDTNGKAYVVLRVGQGVDNEGQGDKAMYEDVNKDLASIYITTAHIIPLEQAFNKRLAWRDRKVVEAKDYNKPQILLTSDRLWLNGRDDMELSAKNFIGLTAEQINIDGQEQISLDAEKIYLGTKATDEDKTTNSEKVQSEPVLKGKTTTDMISKLVDQYKLLLDTIVKAAQESGGDPKAVLSVVEGVAKTIKSSLESYQDELSTLHSTKVFTE